MRILLLSAYDAASHANWRDGLVGALPEVEWTVLTLPPRHFAWRVRGNPLGWLDDPALSKPHDLVLATSMTDLATLRGLVPQLAALPAVAYFHENQFDYPVSAAAHASVEPQLVSVYTALAADRVLFNSRHNRDTFLAGARKLLERMPDHAHPQRIDALAGRCSVVPVGLDPALYRPARKRGPRIQLLWNHRWEYDKGPERLLMALDAIEELYVPFRIHIAGQQFRRQPDAFARIRERHGDHIGQFGFVEDSGAYRRLLWDCDVVLSTALHDFQGLSVLEATAAGCLPLVPDRLAYPEWIPQPFRYLSSPRDPDAESVALAARLADLMGREALLPPDLGALAWPRLADEYRLVFSELIVDPKS
jgi:glycosyltransferase involved in cell wall biosynthesis